MKDFLMKTFKDKKQVFIFVTILLVAFTTFSLLSAILTEGDVEPTEDVGMHDKLPYRTSTDDEKDPDAGETEEEEETMIAPLKDENYIIVSGYWDINGTTEEQQSALIEYGNTFIRGTTTNFKASTEEAFDVVAVFSGKVIRVSETPLYGNVVEIEHDNGVTTIYKSLGDVLVEVDQEVAQGDTIAVSGNCEVDLDSGLHVRLEVRKNGSLVNPQNFLGSKISNIN